jgi:hypothetical protein
MARKRYKPEEIVAKLRQDLRALIRRMSVDNPIRSSSMAAIRHRWMLPKCEGYSAATTEATKNRTRDEGRASVPRIALPTAQRSTVAVSW